MLECDYCNVAWHNKSECLKLEHDAHKMKELSLEPVNEDDDGKWAFPECWEHAMDVYDKLCRHNGK